MDTATSHSWQLRQQNTQLPKYVDLERFLASRCVAFENSEAWLTKDSDLGSFSQSSINKKRNNDKKAKGVLLASNSVPGDKCPCCTGLHKIYSCDKFKELSIKDRLNTVREAHLCFNCLSSFHMSNKCKSKGSCDQCGRKHNSLLHITKHQQSNSQEDENLAQVQNSKDTNIIQTSRIGALAAMPVSLGNSYAFIATAEVIVKDIRGNDRKCRVVLDSGSQVNFISKSFQNVLQLSGTKVLLPVSGIGSSRIRSTIKVEVQISSRVSEFTTSITCYVLSSIIESLSPCTRPLAGWGISDKIISHLADPHFDQTRPVDILIGAGIFFDLLEADKIQLETGNLALQNTKLGWIMTGELSANSLLSIGTTIEADWKLMQSQNGSFGSMSKNNKRCLEEEQAVKHFEETVSRRIDGRFVLYLPLKPEVDQLGNSLFMATSRFLNVERRLLRDEQLRADYVKFMNEYIKMDHMELVIEESPPASRIFYLPHHAVIKTSSLTTKVRVVFDASAKSSSGLSLNDVLMCGPNIQDDLFSILCRFRSHQFVITADVEKMFRQVEIVEKDRDLHRIVWREHPSEPLRTYRLKRVAYGTTSASFMTTKCLSVLAEDANHQYPEAAEAIKRDFYMDDLMTGSHSEEECLRLQREITRILDSGKLPLRKWCSNSSSILGRIDNRINDNLFILELGEEDVIKSLGLCWKPMTDVFQFNVEASKIKGKITKRMLLSALNSIFDPLGFLAPVLVKGKVFLQQLWLMKANWDSSLPDDIRDKWLQYWTDFSELKSLEIPRKTRVPNEEATEFHGFCDASQDAYGACIYVRSKVSNGKWHTQLLCASTRVAPLKGATIPRLELCGALTLTQLAVKVAGSWKCDINKFFLWTDSTIVLGWLNSQPNRLKLFISNRITQILDVTNIGQWRYVKSKDNPADILSRGVKAQDLYKTDNWWHGPSWLIQEEETWHSNIMQFPREDELPERKPLRLALVSIQSPNKLIDTFSSWQRLRRATAWILRFIDYIKSKRARPSTYYLTAKDLQIAERRLLTCIQREVFQDEYLALLKGMDIPYCSKLKSLRPYLKNGLIVVGGRLENSDIPEQQKQPIILPSNHKITQLIFKDRHLNSLHCGPQLLLAEVRQYYWPLRGRIIARSTVRHCVDCVRAKPNFHIPIMAPLPKQRVQISCPFTFTGVDFAGPLIIRSGVRGRVGKKAWISIFVCFSTRAVHIEPVEDLTSKAFIAALRRFIPRRGKPKEIWSDNGTNFVGANKELSTYIKNVDSQMANEGIVWRFNPPAAPHFGGLWEGAVKSAKHHLTRTIKEAKLTLSELHTLLCQVEACLNSRPLTPMSSDPDDLQPLTPAHFLLGRPISQLPELDLSKENPNGLRRWKFVQYLLQTFWKRWQSEYLPQLQIRGKWTSGCNTLAVNDIVIIKEENLTPTKWKMARITRLNPGRDGNVRVVTLQTANGTTMCRPVAKLCRLPVNEEFTIG